MNQVCTNYIKGDTVGSLNMLAYRHSLHINRFTIIVVVFWDRNLVSSMHIKGYMAISIRNVAGDWFPFKDFPSSDSMSHGNNYGCLTMHAIDIVCILIDSKWQWQYFEI